MQTEERSVYLAVDIGASSGRVMAALFDGTRIELEEVHRFFNGAIEIDGEYHWDIHARFDSIKEGLTKAAATYGDAIVSIGVDTWGVDYGLLDANGELMGLPFAYRDPRTNGMEEEAFKRVPREKIYDTTGIQFMFFNTLNQIMSEVVTERGELEKADRLLFTPDLLNYWLCGVATNEYTIASTSQLLDVRKRTWATDMLEGLEIPKAPFGDITMPGTSLGTILPGIATETGLSPKVQVVAVGSHDTASAVAAVPAETDSHAYLSSGTWSLMGVESDEPVVSKQSYDYGFTNEGGLGGKIRLLKNITGLWLVQECRRNWTDAGEAPSFRELEQGAAEATPFQSFIDPDDTTFSEPCDMPANIQAYCERTNQPVPQSRGEIIRTAIESLAFRYKSVFNMLEDLTGKRLDVLHIVGGGTQDRQLNQLTANALNRPVITGPIEATATGNILSQLMADGSISSLAAGRGIVRASFEQEVFEPSDTEAFAEAYARFHEVTGA
ncbi:MAG: rhamnulokinase [Verrucomicrobia bacterium]|jgi:rhamnulokinase|nr:rhamnulokinase [Verrucomicrobiota bacterium]